MFREKEKKLFKSLVSEAFPRVPLTFLVGLLWRERQRKWDLRGHNVSVATNKLDYCVRKIVELQLQVKNRGDPIDRNESIAKPKSDRLACWFMSRLNLVTQ